MNYKISVIIPTYNVEAYIGECLDSIVDQSIGIENIEVIVVDDCSTDTTLDLIKEYSTKYPSITIIEQEKNQGPGIARNTGLNYVNSDYITFMDSDDFISKNTFETTLNKFSKFDCDLVIYKYTFFSESGKEYPLDIHQEIYKESRLIEDIKDVPEIIFATSPCNKIYPRKLIPFLKFQETFYEDNIVAAEILFNSEKIYVTDECTYFYRIRESETESRMQTINKTRCNDLADINVQLYQLLDDYPKYRELITWLNIHFTRYILQWMMGWEFSYEERAKIFNRSQAFLKNITDLDIENFNSYFPRHKIIRPDTFFDARNKSFEEFSDKYLNYWPAKYKISIVIPIHNIEQYLKQTLDSLLKQTIGYQNLEVIMVNDCSTDKSGDLIDKYAAEYENFKAIHLPENSGLPGKPRNVGLENASGEFVMFMDHDDYYSNDACAVLYNKIVDENADIVFSRYNHVFDDRIQESPSSFGDIGEVKVIQVHECEQLLALAPSIWTKLFRRSFIRKNNIWFPEGILAEDLSFVTESFLKANGIVYLNNYFSYNYRIRDSKDEKSTIHIRNEKYLKAMIEGYANTYKILHDKKLEKYFPVIFETNLKYWLKSFIYSATNIEEKKKLLKDVSFLIDQLQDYDIEFDEYSALSISIHNKDYDTAIEISNLMVHYNKREDKVRKYYQRQLKAKKKQVAELQKIKGYSKYKTRNIIDRLRKKV